MFYSSSFHFPLRAVRCLLFTALLLAFLTRATVVQGAAPPTESLTSAAPAAPALETYLASDGTLALPAGFSGSLDTRGWALASGENEPPRFIPASPGISSLGLDGAESPPPRLPGDERWEAGFQPRGVRMANALAAGAGSDLYVAGDFRTAGSTPANYVAKWDGSQWSALGFGLNGDVNELAWDSTSGILYAGGFFYAICTNADCSSTTPADSVAKWNGAVWSPLDSGVHRGVNRTVHALELDPQGNLYVGGEFTGLCKDTSSDCSDIDAANHIAKWTLSGSSGTWSTLSTGVDVSPLALAWWDSVGGGRLVVGGWFTKAGELDVNNLAMWDGSTWNSFWSGVDGEVDAIAVDPAIGAVVVGGNFTHVCATDALPPTCNIYPSNRVNHVAVTTWLLDYWGPLGWGVDDQVFSLAIDSAAKKVYVGGWFDSLCADQPCTPATVTPASYVAVVKYSALPYTWSPLGSGTDSPIEALVVQESNLYAGGYLQVAGGVPATGIARWALAGPGPWSPLNTGDGLSGWSYALAADGDGNIYMGGSLRAAGGIVANNIARWNIQTRTWTALGHGVDAGVHALALDSDGTLFVGGEFVNICSNPGCTLRSPVNHLARWSEAQGWRTVEFGVTYTVSALALAPDGNLYVGGSNFLGRCPDLACSPPYGTNGGLLRWNHSTQTLATFGVGAPSGDVRALAVDSTGALYIGGGFASLCTGACGPGDTRTVNHVAKWTSGGLSTLGSGVSGTVVALAVDASDRLYVGGSFRFACSTLASCDQGTSLNNIGQWTPSEPSGGWSPLHHGLDVDAPVLAVTLDSSGHLFATGGFCKICDDPACTTSGTPANHIATWDGSTWSPLGGGLKPVVFNAGYALAGHAGVLSVGGRFEIAGGKPSLGFARYADLQPPPAPILTAPADGTVFTRNQTIPFSWNPSTDADLYLLEALQNGQVVWNDTTPSPTLVRSASADPPGSYQWRVQAFNSVGQSEWSATRAYSVKPAPPSGLGTTLVSPSEIRLAWTASPDAVFLDGYRLYRNGVAIATVGPSTTTYANTGLACHTSYSYVVKAYKGSVESDPTNTLTGPTSACLPPTKPSQLTAWAASSTQLNLAWQDNSDESAFYLERSLNGTTGWAQIGQVGTNVTTYADPNRTCHTTYYYRVRAYRSSDSLFSPYSNIASATTVACNAPATPGNLTATATSQTKLHLSWQDLSDNESDFHLERSPNGLSAWTQLAVLPAGTVNYDNPSLACGTVYAYRVRAHRHSDNQYSGYSNVASATTQACSGTTKKLYLPLTIK